MGANAASRSALRAAAKQIAGRPGTSARTDGLSLEERSALVSTFITVIEGLYTHLPQKRASYGHDPVQRLRLLQQRLDVIEEDEFHRSLAHIVTDLRDAHTRYIGPTHVGGDIAFLPILVERYTDEEGDHYVVTQLFAADAAEERHFLECGLEPEVEVTHWNGVPIARAVDLHADRETGGRPDARRARALESLTLRPLRYAMPPHEDWVIVSFKRDGKEGEVRLTWRFAREVDLPHSSLQDGPARYAYAGDPAAEAARRVKKMLFATEKWHEDKAGRLTSVQASLKKNAPARGWLSGKFQDAAIARAVETPRGTFGHLRLWSFDINDDDGFLSEVIELLDALPQNGLIVDLRGNPGGLVWAAERLLQLFTPNPVVPTLFSMLATDLTRTMAAAPQSRQRLEPWRRSLDSAVKSGEVYSRGVPLTPVQRCNDTGQRYPGPVVAVVDANTYSSGDLFAAGFVDNRVGTLISVDHATGAGGANVWYPRDLYRSLEGTASALPPLPPGVSFTIAFRRATRGGGIAETGIEDVGVAGHIRHRLTKRDLTDGNKDLLEFCAGLLASEPFSDLQVRAVGGDRIVIVSTNLDRVDVYADGRPIGAPFEADRRGTSEITCVLDQPWSQLEIIGFVGSVRRQRRLLHPQIG